MSNQKKGRGIKKLAFINKLKSYSYYLIVILDKTNTLRIFYPLLNFSLRFLGIKKKYNNQLNYKKYSKIFQNGFSYSKTDQDIILFPFMMGSESSFNLRQLMIAKFLQDKQYKPIFLICNNTFDICIHDRIGKSRKNHPLFCYECCNNYEYIKKQTGILIDYLSDYIDSNDYSILNSCKKKIQSLNTIKELENFKYKDHNIGFITIPTVLRYFYKGDLSDTKEEIHIFKKYLLEGIKVIIIFDRIIEKYKPKKMILWNGVLLFDKVISLLCEKYQIDYVTQEVFIGSNSWIYKKNGIAIHLDFMDEWMSSEFKRKDLSKLHVKKVDNLFKKFKTGEVFDIKLNNTSKIKLDKNVRYVALFTNLNFDTYVLGRNPIFNSMNQWLIETIKYWNENVEGIKLIARVHPGESKFLLPTIDFISDLISYQMSDKIILLDSDDDVNSYDLFSFIDYGICYSSTIGLEMILNKLPVIVAGDTFYNHYIESVNDKKDYFNLIDRYNLNEITFTYNSDELYKYLYYLYYIRTIQLEGFDFDRKKGQAIFESISYNDLLSKNNDSLEMFYNEIFN